MKKWIALLLALGMLLALSACGGESTEIKTYTAEESEAVAAVEQEDAEAAQMEAIHAMYDGSEVVMTVAGHDVTWDEYFYWLSSIVSYIEYYSGSTITDWSATCLLDETQTYEDYATTNILSAITEYATIYAKAEELGVTLSAEDEESLATILQEDIDSYGEGDEATFEEYIETLYLTREIYDYMNKASCFYYDCFTAIYGEDGSKCPDADVASYVEANGLIRVKHILLNTTDEEGEALDETAKAEVYSRMEGLLAEIREAEDQEAKFDELMLANSEDSGLVTYPEGYVFGSGSMEEAFEDASFALEEGSLSDIIETSYGYHIILRLPIDYDQMVQYVSEDEQYSLRYTAATQIFSTTLSSWCEESMDTLTWAPEFENFSIAALFAE